MTLELITGLALFALVSSITPGPNNLMLMASGANFGVRRTLPHLLGVALGFVIMVVLVGLGIRQVFDAWPASYLVLKVLSVLYLGYLAWRIAGAGAPTGSAEVQGKPMTFLAAALFQWVNPKAWAMALTAVTVYSPSEGLAAVVLVAMVFGVINLPSVGLWAVLGEQLQGVLRSEIRLRAFNFTMATLLLVSLVPTLGMTG